MSETKVSEAKIYIQEPTGGCNRTVGFHNFRNQQIGLFNFGVTPATFTGDVDASAALFVDCVCKIWDRHQTDREIMLANALLKIINFTDSEMEDGDAARRLAREVLELEGW